MRNIGLWLLTVYALALVFSGLPNLGVRWLHRSTDYLERTLTSLLMVPGVRIFYDNTSKPFKVFRRCAVIRGYYHNSPSQILFEASNACHPPIFRWSEDIYETMWVRILNAAFDWRRSTNKTALQVIGDFFCHAQDQMDGVKPPDEVGVLYTVEHIEYVSGKRRIEHLLLSKWSCGLRQNTYLAWHRRIPTENVTRFLAGSPW